MVSWNLSGVKLHQGESLVSPSLWFESRDVRLMDDGSERDKEKGWQEADFKSGCCMGTARLCPAL